MKHNRLNKKKQYVLIIALCISTSFLQIHPFYFCCKNNKIHNEIFDPSRISMNDKPQNSVVRHNDPNNDPTHENNLHQSYSQSLSTLPKTRPIMYEDFRYIMRAHPTAMRGMAAFGVYRHRDEDDSISE